MYKRQDLLRSAEDALRIERHDLRHRLRTAAELVAQGKHQEALAFIDDAQRRLDEQKTLHWCEPPVLNAVFSSYFDQAARQGILVDAQIDLSGELPVPEAELAIILANALENAVHACGELPQDERKLRCKIIRRPSLMFEIANPCARTLHFDSQGLPVSRQKGHGVGVQSIVTFCKKYGAACQYEQQDGWLFLRVIL